MPGRDGQPGRTASVEDAPARKLPGHCRPRPLAVGEAAPLGVLGASSTVGRPPLPGGGPGWRTSSSGTEAAGGLSKLQRIPGRQVGTGLGVLPRRRVGRQGSRPSAFHSLRTELALPRRGRERAFGERLVLARAGSSGPIPRPQAVRSVIPLTGRPAVEELPGSRSRRRGRVPNRTPAARPVAEDVVVRPALPLGAIAGGLTSRNDGRMSRGCRLVRAAWSPAARCRRNPPCRWGTARARR